MTISKEIPTLLALDLSTTATGYAVFKADTKELLHYGVIKAKVKGITKLSYPIRPLYKMYSIADQIKELIEDYQSKGFNFEKIAIEEVNRHKSRLSGKTLDGLHWIVLNRFSEDLLKRVKFIDSDGKTGWRNPEFIARGLE